jgi:predicted dehydrogenase
MPTTQGDAPADSSPSTRPLRLAAVGVDSSHLPEFTRRIAALHDAGDTACRVTAMWSAPQADMPEDQVAGWVADAEAMGVQSHASMDAMLDEVDGVMVLAVAGHRHLEFAEPALRRGLPTYIDKPLANSIDDARRIAQLAAEHDAPCYSASSLRFAREIGELDHAAVGDLVAIDAYGPGELHDLMPGVLFYGVHTIEMVDAIWGPGVRRVSAEHHEDRDLIRLVYDDDRIASLRLERRGSYDFGATVHGADGVACFNVDFATVYDRLVAAMVRFFERHEPPVTLDRIVENVAVMNAANASIERSGAWVDLDH